MFLSRSYLSKALASGSNNGFHVYWEAQRDEISFIISSATQAAVPHCEKLTIIKLSYTSIKMSGFIVPCEIMILISFVNQIITSIIF